ncbi:hypothetical protein TPHA_0M00700 [Tetrapisispora phaffii CBS 4417]|uniref:Uncharacterized protein n=1 Tax=Tetrapisispora phaffii (strain ATCC 24235 / CBS 4417 / NBRC 1672 / NRRL Y-8282 / UCD 70-5) TaxID=1071381 RepID=G8C0D0_TETPH|nr:hypothetical protein TPHA_0M00700 [Tetrapisispora phaffii CBS 4417]CCE65645.1 hypothetical protein TPHA_0M00700 [Tetrapisispora phaffii CBS 4417]
MADQFTVSYGLPLPQLRNQQHETHILPVTKILQCRNQDKYNTDSERCESFLTCGRDGSIIKYLYSSDFQLIETKKMQAHSDWVTDLIDVGNSIFISVSHDFSIVLHSINGKLDTWETKIIGCHDDYIKCIVSLPKIFSDYDEDKITFATAGLDKKIKVWSLNKRLLTYKLLHVFDNSQDNGTGSVYVISAVDNPSVPYDLIAGDNNGNIILYSCKEGVEVARIEKAHDQNIKCLKCVDNYKNLISTSSDGTITAWAIAISKTFDDKNNEIIIPLTKIRNLNWNGAPVWCIYGESLKELYVGDAKANIFKVNFEISQPSAVVIFNGTRYPSKADTTESRNNFGILDLMRVHDTNNLFFSVSKDSNLMHLDVELDDLTLIQGGVALTRSSLLTNRRHVITENTRGEIQTWDIISCRLLNTFDVTDGDFNDIVYKYTTKEILPHWCTVSIKVGLLFVKLNARLLSTEVYGAALENYEIINDVIINPDQRFNLGKIVINSLFNEFLSYEIEKDKLLRKRIASKKKDSFFNYQKDEHNNSSLSIENGEPGTSDKKNKDKKKKSHIMKFKLGSPSTQPAFSTTPSTPSSMIGNYSDNDRNINISNNLQNGIKITLESPRPQNRTKQPSIEKLVNGYPNSKTESGTISMSTGSYLNRKLKKLGSRPSSAVQGGEHYENVRTPDSSFDESSVDYGDDNNGTLRPVTATPFASITQSPQQRASSTPALEFSSRNSPLPSASVGGNVSPDNVNQSTGKTLSHSKRNFMCDLLSEFEEAYIQQFQLNSSSLKLLSKKQPESKISKATELPLLRIKFGTLLVIHKWEKDACGGIVVFSTFLPGTNQSLDNNEFNDTTVIMEGEEFDSQIYEDEKLEKFDFIDYEYGHGINRRMLFEQLERNVPYWFAKILFDDNNHHESQSQPKLNFTIALWTDDGPNSNANNTNDINKQSDNIDKPPSSKSAYQRLKFSRNKSTDSLPTATSLPRISEYNSKLSALGMVRIKKIKQFITERFDCKTPEMKAKVDPSDWLEILCKGQVLENDMTLSSVKTLYWKSQNGMVLEYRRKIKD